MSSPDGAAPAPSTPPPGPPRGQQPGDPPSTRVDLWLWSVRLFKSRSLATGACKAGHVRVNGERAKPAQSVKPGDGIEVRGGDRPRIVIVERILTRRVGAPIAQAAYQDHSPPPLPRDILLVPRRERGAGRPTKKERREIERLRGYPSSR
ncbi:MAG TPA: RNA-binding S4 domain-containing protein [Actinomycetaceae bacterium]|nr:RNA-binding S4 domain-containing protein [Actinomycetaceae bacterium]